MRQRWISLIMHTTALIHKKKQDLLVSHVLKSLWDIVLVILLELFLAVISLPLYLVTHKQTKRLSGEREYRIRRVVTLSLLTVIMVIWLLKLGFIMTSRYFVDTRSTFRVSQLQSESMTLENLVTEFALSTAGLELRAPRINDVVHQADGTFAFAGTSLPQEHVFVYVAREDITPGNLIFNMYTAVTGADGQYFATQDKAISYLAPGRYIAIAVAYDAALQQRSSISNVVSFEVRAPWTQKVFQKADFYFNMLIIVFLAVGAFLIVLIV